MALTGTVKMFEEAKGFGFITPDSGGEDVFMHIKQCNGALNMKTGDRVTFDNEFSLMKGRFQGSNCTVVAKAEVVVAAAIKFGIRGDSLLQLRADGGNKAAKRWRTFKAHFESEFFNVFGNCVLDYSLLTDPETRIHDVTLNISGGVAFDILCVGLGMQELMISGGWGPPTVVTAYPADLDWQLEELAVAIKAKSQGSLVFLGGPASFWKLQSTDWDNFMARARNTLRKAGVAVVPIETAGPALEQMTLSTDGLHIANDEDQKDKFAKAWSAWLYAASADPTFGRTVTEEASAPATSWRARSRSPKHVKPQMGKWTSSW